MEEVFNFLELILRNNNREWFQQNKELYLKAQAKVNEMAEQLVAGVSEFDPSCAGLSLKDVTYRIYRDTRFSNDKRPYKTHFGIFVCPEGKKSMLAGYYLHLEMPDSEYLGGNGLHVGMYMPDKDIIRAVRNDILFKGADFEKAIKKAKDFTLNTENNLSRIPCGFPKDNKYSEYLKMRDYMISRDIPENIAKNDELVSWAVNEFKQTYDFTRFLNEAARS